VTIGENLQPLPAGLGTRLRERRPELSLLLQLLLLAVLWRLTLRGVDHAKARRMLSQGLALAQNASAKATPREIRHHEQLTHSPSVAREIHPVAKVQPAGVQVLMPTWHIRLSAMVLTFLQLEPDQCAQRLHEAAVAAAGPPIAPQTTSKNWATVRRLHGQRCCARSLMVLLMTQGSTWPGPGHLSGAPYPPFRPQTCLIFPQVVLAVAQPYNSSHQR